LIVITWLRLTCAHDAPELFDRFFIQLNRIRGYTGVKLVHIIVRYYPADLMIHAPRLMTAPEIY
jgi:hypothetical protein